MPTNRQLLTAYINAHRKESGLPPIRRGRPALGKTCPRCKTMDKSRFGKNKAHSDGLQTYCRECIKNRGTLPLGS